MEKNQFNIFFAPVSSGDLLYNFEKTVVKGVSLEELDNEYHNKFNGKGSIIRLWGIRDAKRTTFNKTKSGDIILFYKQGLIVGYSTVKEIFIDEHLSKKLWGTFENKREGVFYSWPNIILLESFHESQIPFSTFRALGGYNEKFSVRGFLQYKHEATNKLITEYGGLNTFLAIIK